MSAHKERIVIFKKKEEVIIININVQDIMCFSMPAFSQKIVSQTPELSRQTLDHRQSCHGTEPRHTPHSPAAPTGNNKMI